VAGVGCGFDGHRLARIVPSTAARRSGPCSGGVHLDCQVELMLISWAASR